MREAPSMPPLAARSFWSPARRQRGNTPSWGVNQAQQQRSRPKDPLQTQKWCVLLQTPEKWNSAANIFLFFAWGQGLSRGDTICHAIQSERRNKRATTMNHHPPGSEIVIGHRSFADTSAFSFLTSSPIHVIRGPLLRILRLVAAITPRPETFIYAEPKQTLAILPQLPPALPSKPRTFVYFVTFCENFGIPCQLSAPNSRRVIFTRHQISVGTASYIWGMFLRPLGALSQKY
jgi:hypothetical protein